MTPKSPDSAPATAFYAGSFNPFTTGHLNIVERGLRMFSRVVIGVGINPSKPLPPGEAQRRVEQIERAVASLPGVSVVAYSSLTVREARRLGASVLLRGVRTMADFDYERNLAEVNRLLDPEIDTVVLFADPAFGAVSSSAVRELASFGEDVTPFLPPSR